MTAEEIKPPHYYAGVMAVWGSWRPLSPGRMSYTAGFRWYRGLHTGQESDMRILLDTPQL